jgi:hypothetical protein
VLSVARYNLINLINLIDFHAGASKAGVFPLQVSRFQKMRPRFFLAKYRERAPGTSLIAMRPSPFLVLVGVPTKRQHMAEAVNPVSRRFLTRKGHEHKKRPRAHARSWAPMKVASDRFSLIVDDGDRKLRQRGVGLLFFPKGGVEQLYCPVYAQLAGPSLQSAVA